MLYELFTGKRPFESLRYDDALRERSSGPPSSLSSHPLGFRQIPGFSGLLVDRQEANHTQGVGPEIPVSTWPHTLIPNLAQSLHDWIQVVAHGRYGT